MNNELISKLTKLSEILQATAGTAIESNILSAHAGMIGSLYNEYLFILKEDLNDPFLEFDGCSMTDWSYLPLEGKLKNKPCLTELKTLTDEFNKLKFKQRSGCISSTVLLVTKEEIIFYPFFGFDIIDSLVAGDVCQLNVIDMILRRSIHTLRYLDLYKGLLVGAGATEAVGLDRELIVSTEKKVLEYRLGNPEDSPFELYIITGSDAKEEGWDGTFTLEWKKNYIKFGHTAIAEVPILLTDVNRFDAFELVSQDGKIRYPIAATRLSKKKEYHCLLALSPEDCENWVKTTYMIMHSTIS